MAVALAVLMTALFTRMLVTHDAGQIAIQPAIGAGDAGLRSQYLTRILLVLVLGVVVGTVAANTIGEKLFNLMFEGNVRGVRNARPRHEPDRLRREPAARTDRVLYIVDGRIVGDRDQGRYAGTGPRPPERRGAQWLLEQEFSAA